MKANLLKPLLGGTALALGAMALASCGDSRVIPAPTAAPAPLPSTRPAQLPQVPRNLDWRDAAITPGDWQWSGAGGQSIARFAGGRLSLQCDPAARSVRIERNEPGSPVSGAVRMTVITQTQMRPFNALAQAGSVAVSLGARDPLLDAMAFSKGRFVVEVAGLPTLYVPSWTEVSRVVEDCR
jgi:hypothetical protein